MFRFILKVLFSVTYFHWALFEGSCTNVGEPLFLTPYIENGSIEEAQNLSMVLPMIGGWTSYAGYFTVNKNCGSNIFFWFIRARYNWPTAPVLLWLQGGPGSASLYGLFEEIGPFNHFPSGLVERNYTWNNDCNIIYMDQPVGTGYSFSRNNCLAENMTAVTNESYSALTQFFQLFPQLQNNSFFITGESFAGHYIPPLAIKIHNNTAVSAVKINLKGYMIGNTLTNLSCHNYANILYAYGSVGESLRDEINSRHEMLIAHAAAGHYGEANKDWYYILNNLILEKTDLPSRESMIAQPSDTSDYAEWVNSTEVRCQIHVGEIEYNDLNYDVYNKLLNTIAEPMTRYIEIALQETNLTIGFYSGNLDMICLYTSTECMLRYLQWWGASEYLDADRYPWYEGGLLAGWYKMAGPIYFVVLKDAGHSVPLYKPAPMYQLMKAVITSEPGTNPASKLKTSP